MFIKNYNKTAILSYDYEYSSKLLEIIINDLKLQKIKYKIFVNDKYNNKYLKNFKHTISYHDNFESIKNGIKKDQLNILFYNSIEFNLLKKILINYNCLSFYYGKLSNIIYHSNSVFNIENYENNILYLETIKDLNKQYKYNNTINIVKEQRSIKLNNIKL